MQTNRTIQFMVTIPKQDRDLLVKMAAKRNLHDPDSHATAAGIGREILSAYLEEYRQGVLSENTQNGGEHERWDTTKN